MQSDLKKLEDAGINVVGISYDEVDVLDKFTKSRKIGFPLLSDPDSKAITEYGLLNEAAKGRTEGIPFPGTVVIDKTGVIRDKLFHEGYAVRHTSEDLLKAVEKLKTP